MKKIIEEVEGEGLESLLGKRATFFCARYIYTGDVIGVNDKDILLKNGGIVYDTGSFDNDKWDDYQEIKNPWYVRTASIESYGILK